MKYTKEQLQEMGDSGVNKALEKLTRMYCEDCAGKYIKMMDYCKRPNDIIPLQIEYGISVNKSSNFVYSKSETLWTASEGVCGGIDFDCDSYGVEFEDENPLRAIACCLILVLQEGE